MDALPGGGLEVLICELDAASVAALGAASVLPPVEMAAGVVAGTEAADTWPAPIDFRLC